MRAGSDLAGISVPTPRIPDPEDLPLRTDLEAIAAAADDFEHLVHHLPTAVARPRYVGDVAAIVRYARSAGLTVRPRGGGHSMSGRAQCENGIVCDMTSLDHIWGMDKRFRQRRIAVGAGARWSQVLAVTLEQGLTPRVLPDYLELTVGGTLSAGGIGGASHQYGPQVDNVLGLDVVDPEGRELYYRPDPGRYLAAQGREGIIVEAKIPLVPAPSMVRRYKVQAADLGSLLAWQRRIAVEGRFGYLEGQVMVGDAGRWQFMLEAAWC